MKDIFPEYFLPSSSEFDTLWDSAIVSFDANILLHVLRFKQNSADEILKVIENLGDRAWLTNQAAKEFLVRRHTVFLDLATPYNDLQKKLEEMSDEFEGTVDEVANKHRDHPSLDFGNLKAAGRKGFNRIQENINSHREGHPTDSHADLLVERVSKIFSGKVGEKPDESSVESIEKEGKDRFSKKIPPGYMDQNKNDGGYGDLFVWLQLIEKASAEKKPLIFVTDDQKEDWWRRVQGRTIGPRPELREEFTKKTGQQFYMYSLSNYLTHTKDRGSAVSVSAIREAEKEAKRAQNVTKNIISTDDLKILRKLQLQRAASDRVAKYMLRMPSSNIDYGDDQARMLGLNDEKYKVDAALLEYFLDLQNRISADQAEGRETPIQDDGDPTGTKD